jgi:hypothetical protein
MVGRRNCREKRGLSPVIIQRVRRRKSSIGAGFGAKMAGKARGCWGLCFLLVFAQGLCGCSPREVDAVSAAWAIEVSWEEGHASTACTF